jgi:hypothetical protein
MLAVRVDGDHRRESTRPGLGEQDAQRMAFPAISLQADDLGPRLPCHLARSIRASIVGNDRGPEVTPNPLNDSHRLPGCNGDTPQTYVGVAPLLSIGSDPHRQGRRQDAAGLGPVPREVEVADAVPNAGDLRDLIPAVRRTQPIARVPLQRRRCGRLAMDEPRSQTGEQALALVQEPREDGVPFLLPIARIPRRDELVHEAYVVARRGQGRVLHRRDGNTKRVGVREWEVAPEHSVEIEIRERADAGRRRGRFSPHTRVRDIEGR